MSKPGGRKLTAPRHREPRANDEPGGARRKAHRPLRVREALAAGNQERSATVDSGQRRLAQGVVV
jgi:hypothetical protein